MTQYLITGGSGSFGNAYVEHLLSLPEVLASRICIYSRDEYKQSVMRDKFEDNDRLRFFIGDIRCRDRLEYAMEGIDVVIHGAALKRVEVCEYSPLEVTKTNVQGSVNVIEAAYSAKVKKVVALSTDKAANPANVYGATKLLAEKLFIAANNMYGDHGPKYSCVKYGNVWGSRGSIFPKWREILKTSDTVPVTDPDCTRYFMYLHESVRLVQDTIDNMKGGEINIPKLPAYQLSDLAAAMGAKMDIVGLPDREKVDETMDGVTTSKDARRMSVEELKEIIKNET